MFKRIRETARKTFSVGLASLMLVSSMGITAMAAMPKETVVAPDGSNDGERAAAMAKVLLQSEESYVEGSARLTYADSKQFGIFANSTLGSTVTDPIGTIPEGIVLSTGDATQAFLEQRPTGGTFGSTANDPDMAKIINSVQQHDTVALEFDIQTEGNVLDFSYMFASNEFDQDKRYYDTMAIFVNGENIAHMVDDPTANIDVRNLKNGEETVIVKGNEYYSADMDFSDSAFIGHTPLINQLAYVEPGSKVHVKIAITDLADDAYDSAVFLKAKSIETRSAVQIEKSQGSGSLEHGRFTNQNYIVAGGQDITYAITVRNTSGIEATNVVVTDYIPKGMTLKGIDGLDEAKKAGSHVDGTDEVVWSLGNLAPGEVRTVGMICTVPTTEGYGIWHNVAEVRSDNGSAMKSNMTTCVKDGAPHIVVSKIQGVNREPAGTDPVTVGPLDTITYYVSVYNNGKGSARNLVVTDTIPEGLELMGASISGSGAWDEDNCITWNIGELKTGEHVTMTYVCQAPESTVPSKWENTACATFSTSNSVALEHVYSNTVVVEKDGEACLELGTQQKVNDRPFTSGEVSVVAGNRLTYEVSVTNTGAGTATDVVVKNPIPQGLSFVEGSITGPNGCEGYVSQGEIIWRVESIKAGETLKFGFKCDVGQTDSLNKYVEKATASYLHANIVDAALSTSNEINAIKDGMPVLNVKAAHAINGGERTQSQRSVEAGDQVEYFLTVVNEGQGTAKDVVLTTLVPDGLTYTKGTISEGGTEQSHRLEWKLGDIEPGKSATVKYQVSVPTTGEHQSYESVAEASFKHTNDGTVNSVSSNILTLNKDGVSAMRIDMSQTAGNDLTNETIVVKEGTTVKYRIAMTNNGNGVAKDVNLIAMIPAEGTLDIKELSSDAEYLLRKNAAETADFVGLLRLFSLTNETELDSNGFVKWTFDQVKPGEQVVREYMVTLPRGSARAEFSARAVATYGSSNDPKDIQGQSNDVKATFSTSSVMTAQLTQSLNGGDFTASGLTSVKKDDKIMYKIVVRNTGDAPVSNVVITDRVPSTLLIDAKSISNEGVLEDGKITWSIREFAANESREFTFEVAVPGTNGSMTWTNTVAVSGSNMNTANSNSVSATTSGTLNNGGTVDNNNGGNTNNGGNGSNTNNNGSNNNTGIGNNGNGTTIIQKNPDGSSTTIKTDKDTTTTTQNNGSKTTTTTSNKAAQAAADNAKLANSKKYATPQTGVDNSMNMALNVVLGIMGAVALCAGGVLVYMKKTGKNPFKKFFNHESDI